MTKSIKTALIGCGYWGKNYLRLLEKNDFFQLTHVVDKADPNVDGVEYLDDISRLKDTDVDCAIVCTPTSTHFEISKQLLNMNIHLLVEKPIATSMSEVEELYQTSESKELVLMTDYTFLYNSVIQKIFKTIENNELGNLQYLQFERSNLGPIRTDVSVIWDLLTHDISILSSIIKDLPKKINSSGLLRKDKKFHDVVNVALNFDDIFVNCFVSWLHPEKIRQIRFVGDKKMMIFDDLNTNEPLKILDKAISSIDEKDFENSSYFNFKVGDTFIPFIENSEPLMNVLLDFKRRILKQPFNDLNNKELTIQVTSIIESVLNDLEE
tara:strand:+ start:5182 stop:6153 length:972 start_codon:yes stop_codon:yes gene_type:complete